MFVRYNSPFCSNPFQKPLGFFPAYLSPSLFPLFCKNRQKLNPSFSISSALFKKEYSRIFFPINRLRTLLQNTGGGTPSGFFHIHFESLFLAALDDSLQLTENSMTLSGSVYILDTRGGFRGRQANGNDVF